MSLYTITRDHVSAAVADADKAKLHCPVNLCKPRAQLRVL